MLCNDCTIAKRSRGIHRGFVRLVAFLMFPFMLVGCDNAIQKNEANFATEIENLVINLGGTVEINEVSHRVTADTQVFCQDAPKPRLEVGVEAVQVDSDSDSSSLRLNPGIDAGVRAAISTGDHVFVLFGPICADGYNWFVVAGANYNVGWAAEADKDGKTYWFAPVEA